MSSRWKVMSRKIVRRQSFPESRGDYITEALVPFLFESMLGDMTPEELARGVQAGEIMFEIDGLTAEEMASIEGDWGWLRPALNIRGNFRYDRKAHNFRSGPLQGRRSHLQATFWLKGKKGSQVHVRIPLWRAK